jgi:hypothetical protein
MRHHLIFLAGDAAHVHSPAGGQGMNAGIQDAYNLAWKLALVIKGKAKPLLLNSYHAERYPIVKNIVTQTEQLTKMALFDKKFLSKLNTFSKRFSPNNALLCKQVGNRITQLNISYDNSPVIAYDHRITKSSKQGKRAPDVIINSSQRLYDFFHQPIHYILLFTGLSVSKNINEKLSELQNWMNTHYIDTIKTYIITQLKLKNSDCVIFDVDNVIHNRYKATRHCIYIIRPDYYIAYYSKKINPELIKKFFKKYLLS